MVQVKAFLRRLRILIGIVFSLPLMLIWLAALIIIAFIHPLVWLATGKNFLENSLEWIVEHVIDPLVKFFIGKDYEL